MKRVTVRELSQLRYLKREIEIERERISKLRERAVIAAALGDGTPRAKGAKDRVGVYACEIAYLEQLIKQNMQRAICELLRLQRFINEIEESDTRLLFYYRYVKGKSWASIAFIMELGDEATARKRHNIYLKEGRNRTRDSRTRRAQEQGQAGECGNGVTLNWNPNAAAGTAERAAGEAF